MCTQVLEERQLRETGDRERKEDYIKYGRADESCEVFPPIQKMPDAKVVSLYTKYVTFYIPFDEK